MVTLDELRRMFEDYHRGRLRAPGVGIDSLYPDPLPIARQLTSEDRDAIFELLKQYRVFDSAVDVMAALREAGAMVALRGQSMEVAMQDLVSRDNGLGLARRVQERYGTLLATGGNPDQNLMWVTEDDERVCSRCEANAGDERTFREWAREGLPGAQTCLGGDRCRCELIPVD